MILPSKALYQTFADTYNLIFTPNQTPQMAGLYRTHQVQICLAGLADQTSTWISLLINNEAGVPLIPKDRAGQVISANRLRPLLIPDKVLRDKLKGEIDLQAEGQQLVYEQFKGEVGPDDLRFLLDLLSDLADNYASIIITGGELIPTLQEIATEASLQDIAAQLLLGIGRETTRRFGQRTDQVFCPYCFARYDICRFPLLRWKPVIYYGCRLCGQSRHAFEGRLVAVLDNEMELVQVQQAGRLRVNWLKLRVPFDFNELEIGWASDEEVERFVVQIRNDTDPVRRACWVGGSYELSPACELSENTLKILEQMFDNGAGVTDEPE